jgi:hypothetical protein
MAEGLRTLALAAACTLLLAATATAAHAKIICWKDKAGKVVGCGDTVPPEYQQGATSELDKQGRTRRTTESAEEAAKRRVQEEAAARAKAESDRRAAEQQRQDSALLNTFASEQEIDVKRERDLQVVELQVSQLRGSLKTASDRQRDARARQDAAEKAKRPVPAAVKDEVARSGDEVQRLEKSIAAKEQEKEAIRAKYADYKKRYAELKGGNRKQEPATK